MAGILEVGTIKKGSASANVDDVINGCAKAWVNFNGTGTVSIRASYNVSSITDNGVGDYTLNFTNALSDIEYSVIGSASETTTNVATRVGATGATYTTSACRIMVNSAASTVDRGYVCISVFR